MSCTTRHVVTPLGAPGCHRLAVVQSARRRVGSGRLRRSWVSLDRRGGIRARVHGSRNVDFGMVTRVAPPGLLASGRVGSGLHQDALCNPVWRGLGAAAWLTVGRGPETCVAPTAGGDLEGVHCNLAILACVFIGLASVGSWSGRILAQVPTALACVFIGLACVGSRTPVVTYFSSESLDRFGHLNFSPSSPEEGSPLPCALYIDHGCPRCPQDNNYWKTQEKSVGARHRFLWVTTQSG